MPKAKNKKAVVKRIKITASGKILRRNQMMNHLQNSKSSARVRRQQEPKGIHKSDEQRIRKMLPNL